MFRRSRRSPGVAPGTAVLLAAIVLALPASWLTLRGQQPTFRAAVDLIAIDVQVLDRNGQPLATLGPDSFDVTLNGQRRPVQYAVFNRYDAAPPRPSTATTPTPQSLLTQPLPAPGSRGASVRTFIISIDAGSFRTLDAHVAVLAAQRFIDGLPPSDEVGVFTVPFGPRLLPTTDHGAARRAVGKVIGRKLDLSNKFEFTPEEVIDILAAAESKPRYLLEEEIRRNRRPNSLLRSDDNTMTEEVISKHCQDTDSSCFDQVVSEASAVAFNLETDALTSIAGIEELLVLLQDSPGRKAVVLLSGGMPLSDRASGAPSVGNALTKMGEQAAYANATVHAIYFDSNLNASFSSESRRARSTSNRSQTIDTRAIAQFSAPSGGLLLTSQAGAAENEVDRLLAETSTSYVLGVEPDQRDRDGRPHRIEVKVAQQGAKVRSRQFVVVPRLP